MTRKLMVTFVVAFVILTVIVAALNAGRTNQRRPTSPATQTNRTLNLDTTPPHFP